MKKNVKRRRTRLISKFTPSYSTAISIDLIFLLTSMGWIADAEIPKEDGDI